MASPPSNGSHPEGVFSFLDTDLYKLTMQCAVLKFFPSIEVAYAFTNRTPSMRLNRAAFAWLETQIAKLADITLSYRELGFLRKHCPYFGDEYLGFLQNFRLRPREQVRLRFEGVDEEGYGDLGIEVAGLWVETILYEIPLLALTSEAFFRFVDTDWGYEGQEEKAYEKGVKLLKGGCSFSDFGTRRRRDFETQRRVVRGLVRASKDVSGPGTGTLSGTSNVYMAMESGINPIGTVAHEWYMGIAAITDNYETANEQGLRFWMQCFGKGVLGVALTDTFGTPNFFKAFKKPIQARRRSSAAYDAAKEAVQQPSFAEVYTGIRQDSGDPKEYVKLAAEFYEAHGFPKRTIVFSDSLNVDLCFEYKKVAEQHGFVPSFGVGTFFTNDYTHKSSPETKSKPLNIVIKLSKAGGQPAVKISDNAGKNTGDASAVKRVKDQLGYTEGGWEGVEENSRW
ncbi:Nicotinate phosphoribosyltransferase [Cyphellophora attinorum]|uniref:nicotinate phosphoribosyltransferase n=1 Tax=Cyphellophora attinorum TaxID=1664694 RepID=A0A0N0NSB5_9EURO|nr:Nicotinate phosphoribosyltransferase [Phialophora attinorum]KPI46061.1 Nicotinate phosphoribosyltransferase [Phialophora attinorum]